MFNRDDFHLVQPVPNGSMYTYVTTDKPEEIEAPDYFKRLQSNTNVRECDVVRVISDQGDTKHHAEFCFMQVKPIVCKLVGEWRVTTLDEPAEVPEPTDEVVNKLVNAFKNTDAALLGEDGYPA